MNVTNDASRNLRHTRLILLSTLLFVGLTGSGLVLIWLIRSTRRHLRSTRLFSLILNLIIANLSVYTFATGVQIFWEFQPKRQWPFNDFLCRAAKFLQSFSILSSTYIVVALAIDRCIAILRPLHAGQIRVLYLCGSAWLLASILSMPNIFIFKLRVNNTERYCEAVFNHEPTLLRRRIYLTFISLVVYFIPFVVLVLCYTLIFIKLLFHERDQQHDPPMTSSTPSCCRRFLSKRILRVPEMFESTSQNPSVNDVDIGRKRTNTYARARSKTFRMIVVLVLFMIVCGAPYYFLELITIYSGKKPSLYVLALAGGAAVAPSSIDPWIFLLFWVNWKEPTHEEIRGQRLIRVSNQNSPKRSNPVDFKLSNNQNQWNGRNHLYPVEYRAKLFVEERRNVRLC